LSKDSRDVSDMSPIWESSSVTKATVVHGLGYPSGRDEHSDSPTGWQATTEEITSIKKQVSRETSR
jgi:hypothetical protein